MARKKLCYMCGGDADSRDHVPPQCFFPEDDRHQLITVPCCCVCNNSFKHLDEDFRAFVAGVENATPAGTKILLDKVFSAKARGPSYQKLRASFREVQRIGNGAAETVGMVTMPEVEAVTFLKRLAKGLTAKVYPEAWSIQQYCVVRQMNDPHPAAQKAIEAAEKLLPYLKHDSRGTGVFDFYHGLVLDSKCSTVWIFGFYRAAWYLVLSSSLPHPNFKD